MAAFDTTRPLAGSVFGGRATNIMTTLFALLADWNDRRATRKALSQLSQRELNDIGLLRADVDVM